MGVLAAQAALVELVTRHPDSLTVRYECGAALALGDGGGDGVGQQVARRARGFNMPVIYHNRRRDEAAERELGAGGQSAQEPGGEQPAGEHRSGGVASIFAVSTGGRCGRTITDVSSLWVCRCGPTSMSSTMACSAQPLSVSASFS